MLWFFSLRNHVQPQSVEADQVMFSVRNQENLHRVDASDPPFTLNAFDKWRETDHHWIFDMAMLQNYCFRPNLDGSWWININHFQCCDSIDTYGSPHSYKWQRYIPEIVDCMLYQVVGPPIYAQISPGSHTFVTSECILYIYIDSSLVESFFGWTYMPKFWLKNHGQDVIFVSFSFGQASRCRRHNGGLSGWCRMASVE